MVNETGIVERALVQLVAFTSDIHIFGLTLDFVETDLWWLLTYRARNKFYKKKSKSKKPDLLKISNKITYPIPEKFAKIAAHKLQVLGANDIIINIVPNLEGVPYYNSVLDGNMNFRSRH